MAGTMGFYVRSLSAPRAVEKLARAGIAVFGVREVGKNTLDVHIRAKDGKKAFAILRGSCYNIENIRYFGLARAYRTAVRAVGLLVGALLFAGTALFAQTRVLAVEIVGSGAYYAREIRAILREEGVDVLSPMPHDRGRLTARVIALPRVEFCTFRTRGGVLTVEVQCAETIEPITGMPLLSPVSGILEELTVIRGTPLVEVGAEVREGETVVAAYSLYGETRVPTLVMARMRVLRAFSADYEVESSEAAVAQAMLEFGETAQIHTEKTQRGWHVEGTVSVTSSVNLG